jgi:poly(3-hydroxybutyrate) depolymerase
MRFRTAICAAVAVASLWGCGAAKVRPGGDQPPATTPTALLTPEARQLVAERPYRLVVPPGYYGQPLPFVILLHGYSGSGQAMDDYLNMSSIASARTFLLATPDGAFDQLGYRY